MSVLVLVVDDEPDVEALFRQQFRRDLRAQRFVMDFAISAADALMRIADPIEQTLILILSDINMPGMTGEDLIRVLRADRPELPVVVVTGSSPRGGLDELRRYGGGHGPFMLLHKPIDYADLVDTVRRAVFPKRLRPAAYNEL